MQLPRLGLNGFSTFCFYSECYHAMKETGMKDHGARGAQLSQMFQLSSDSSQPTAKCKVVLEPRQIPAKKPTGEPTKF